MQLPTLTFLQAFKFLFSLMWRTWVLMIPFGIIWGLFIFFVIGIPKQGEPPPQPNIGLFFIVWIIMMGGFLFAQLQGLRWVLKCNWSDFELKVVSKERSPD